MRKEIKLELNGQTYIYTFGLGFLGECLDNLGFTPPELDKRCETNPFKTLPQMMYESIKYNNEIDFTQKEFIKLLNDDERGWEKAGFFYGEYLKSMVQNVPKQPTNKKKVIPQLKKQ